MKITRKKMIFIFLNFILLLPFTASAVLGDPSTESGGGGWSVNNFTQYNLPQATLYDVIENILYWLLGILGIAGIIGFLISGIMYLTSAGDDAQIKKAKSAMTASIYGVVIGLAGVVALKAADNILRGRIF